MVAVMTRSFHSLGNVQKAITGAVWALIAILVIGVALASLEDYNVDMSGRDEGLSGGWSDVQRSTSVYDIPLENVGESDSTRTPSLRTRRTRLTLDVFLRRKKQSRRDDLELEV